MVYIQRIDENGLETVDEFTSNTEAKKMLIEYRSSDPSAIYRVSSRATKAWRDK